MEREIVRLWGVLKNHPVVVWVFIVLVVVGGINTYIQKLETAAHLVKWIVVNNLAYALVTCLGLALIVWDDRRRTTSALTALRAEMTRSAQEASSAVVQLRQEMRKTVEQAEAVYELRRAEQKFDHLGSIFPTDDLFEKAQESVKGLDHYLYETQKRLIRYQSDFPELADMRAIRIKGRELDNILPEAALPPEVEGRRRFHKAEIDQLARVVAGMRTNLKGQIDVGLPLIR